MAARSRVLERSPYSQLFEAPDIVQHTTQPSKVGILFKHAAATGNFLAQRSNPHRVRHFNGDTLVVADEGSDVLPKSGERGGSIDATQF